MVSHAYVCVAVFLERGRQSLSCSNINVTYVTVVIWKEGYQQMCVPTSVPFLDLDTGYGHDGFIQT
jgi:hypothetical protein